MSQHSSSHAGGCLRLGGSHPGTVPDRRRFTLTNPMRGPRRLSERPRDPPPLVRDALGRKPARSPPTAPRRRRRPVRRDPARVLPPGASPAPPSHSSD
ncbi:hypothetical protein DPV79_29965 [Burkholderia reimsis]|uniref:Uncharacterized protein n=1 Tax=Burkholderia reimsis TaxID=2234132 RepID=A0A365QMD6_9BURK|nr:hypothetical protein DPV79_29965 [Burkholderia reimsis]